MRQVRFISLYRIVARIFPVKQRLNFLISSHLSSDRDVFVPYYSGYGIVLRPSQLSQDTVSDLIFEGAEYLPEFAIINVLKSKLPPNYTYVDVGSNIGTTVWLFAREAQKVYAFEPIPHLYGIISASISNNRATNIILEKKAIGNECGEISMQNNNNSSVLTQKSENALSIPLSTLDKELASVEKIHLIKIDVEGFELKVLEGAVNIIQKHKPVLLIEIHPGFIKQYGGDCRLVLDFLEQNRYSINYYSFLHNLRMSRVNRLINRWIKYSGKHLKDKQAFFDDIAKKPELSSYHLICEPAKP